MMPPLSSIFSLRREYVSFGMRLLYVGLAFSISVLLARMLGPNQLGSYFEAMAWVLLLASFVQSGWTAFVMREVAALVEQRKSSEVRRTASLAVGIVALAATAAALLLIGGAFLSDANEEEMRLFYIGAPALVLLATSTIRQSVLRGLGSPLAGQVVENVTRPGVQLFGLLCYWAGLFGAGFTPVHAMAIFLIAVAVSAAVAYIMERRGLADHPAGGAADTRLFQRSWLKSLAQNAVIAWSTALSLQIGVLVLGVFRSGPEIADFRIAQQLSLLLPIGVSTIGIFYTTDFTRAFVRGDMQTIQRLASRTAIFSFAAAMPLALIFLLAGADMISLIFGPDYAGAATPLAIMTIGQVAYTFFGAVTAISLATRTEGLALRAHVVAAIVNALLCLALVPWLGTIGAAIGSSAALILWNVILFVLLKRRFGIVSSIRVPLPTRTKG